MIKSKSYIFTICLLIFFINLMPFQVKAVPIGGISKILKGLGKGTDIIKPGSKIATPSAGDDILKRLNKSETSTELNSNTLLSKDANKNEILNAHGVRKLDKIIDGKDAVEVANDTFGQDNSDTIINIIRVPLWIGRVFRASNNFNEPELDERLIIECQTSNEVFTFTALLSNNTDANAKREVENWFLLSRHFPSAQLDRGGKVVKKKSSYYTAPMPKQELIVLEDREDYIIFSNNISVGKKYPTKYFIISANAKFVVDLNLHGTESPDYIKINAKKKIQKSNFNCLKKNMS